jgi:uncharacterized membrane protein YqjE
MDETCSTEGSVLSSATRLFKTLHAVAENRAALFLVELKEERVRLFDALLLAALGIVGALMTLVMLTLTVVVAFWETHRLLVLVLITVAYAGTTAGAFITLRSRLRRWRAFSATLDQIKKDRSCLEKTN